MKLENNGSEKFKELFLKTKNESIGSKNNLNEELPFEKLRIVDLLQGLIKINYPLHALLVDNGWLEFDTTSDLELYNNMKDNNTLSQFITLD